MFAIYTQQQSIRRPPIVFHNSDDNSSGEKDIDNYREMAIS
jgi:hypothetical protein